MSASIEQAVMQIKHDVSKAFDAGAIVALCRSIGYSWRTRQFDPVATIQGFLLQVLHGNTACSNVPRLLGKDVTAEAYGMARSRLPLELFQRLLEQVCSRLRECVDTAAGWHGHRVWMPRKGPRKGASQEKVPATKSGHTTVTTASGSSSSSGITFQHNANGNWYTPTPSGGSTSSSIGLRPVGDRSRALDLGARLLERGRCGAQGPAAEPSCLTGRAAFSAGVRYRMGMFDSAEETPMTTIRIVGRIDSEHRLTATVPESVPAGSVEVVLIVPEAAGDPADQTWEMGIAREWSQDLADSRQDIYSLDDGEPVDDAG